MLTTRAKNEIAGAGLALVAIAIVLGSWRSAHREAVQLKAALETQNAVLAAAGKQETARDAALKTSLEQIEDLKKRVQTPQQVISQLPQVLPLPKPISLVPVAPAAHGGGPETGPAPAGEAILPAVDLKPLFDFGAACKECQATVATLQQDKLSDAAKLGAMTKERDAAVAAAKGGKIWTRIKRAAKWFAIGAGFGAAALCGSGHCK
jgi:hypothetical protein